jgi:hypothetical protein
MPLGAALPRPLILFFRFEPLEEQETSYLAASDKIFNFSMIYMAVISTIQN